jgi:hypothetical protein
MLVWQVVTFACGSALVAGGSVETDGTAPFLTGLFILGVSFFLALSIGATYLAPVSLVRGQLRVRGFWWRRRSYPVQGVSGLAMVWSRRGRWTAGLWDSSGELQFLISIGVTGGSGTQLERTHGGQTLIALYQAIEAAQGPKGALQSRALQRDDTRQAAIWDPTTQRTRLGVVARK